MKRDILTAQLRDITAERSRLEAERVALPLGERERSSNLRIAITRLDDDRRDIEAELLQLDAFERSAARTAQRANGRAARAKALHAVGIAAQRAQAFEALARQTIAAATAWAAACGQASEQARAAISAHFGSEHEDLLRMTHIALPAAAGQDGAVPLHVALLLRDLVLAVPCSERLQVDFLLLNHSAFSVGRRSGAERDPLTMQEALDDAARRVSDRLAGLCEETSDAEAVLA